MAGDKEAMIASALSAGPASVTDNATVKDHEGNILKQGNNGYTCYPAGPTMSHDPKDPVYVMWGDTPYAHIMVRIAESE